MIQFFISLIFITVVIIYLTTQTRFVGCIEGFINNIRDSNFKNIEKVITRLDGGQYAVQAEYDDKHEAAEMIAELNNIVLHFIDHLVQKYPSDPRVHRIKTKYNPKVITEGNPFNDENSTSYSISKGEQMVWCVRSKKDKKIHDKNLLMFVILHELSHVASVSYGHNAEFLKNFQFILREAIDEGIYVRQNFFAKPAEYCGMTIKTTPV